MRLLVASLDVPWPPTSGHRLRLAALLQGLSEEGHDVTLVSLISRSESREIVMEGVGRWASRVDLIPKASNPSRLAGYLERMIAILSTRPHYVTRCVSKAMRQVLTQHLSGGGFDAVICEEMGPLVNLDSVSAAPVIADTTHVGYILLERYARRLPNVVSRVYARVEARKMRAWETRMLAATAIVGVCSEAEGELFRQLCPSIQTAVLPNVIDVESYRPQPGDPMTVIYSGVMDWFPNQDAVEFFIRSILPRIRQKAPGVRFVAAGRNPPARFQRRLARHPGVEFTGTVPDMRPLIAEAAVSVVPLRVGSGTRLKILEAAAMAKPIVSTSIGAEGLEFVAGKEILLADRPEDFADAVAGLLASPSRRLELGAARQRVERSYSFPALQAACREALMRVGQEVEAGRG